jgi:hypothetical protein
MSYISIPLDASSAVEPMFNGFSKDHHSSWTRTCSIRPMKSLTPLSTPYDVDRAVVERTFQTATKECKEHNRRYSKQSSGSFLPADLRTTWQQPPLLNLGLGYEVSIEHTLALRLLGISTTQYQLLWNVSCFVRSPDTWTSTIQRHD